MLFFCENACDRARLLAVRSKHAGQWLTVDLTRHNTLSPDAFGVAVRVRLGLELANATPTRCGLCLKQVNAKTNPDHYLSCGKASKQYTRRHNTVLTCMERCLKRFDAVKNSIRIDPPNGGVTKKQTRIDLEVATLNGVYIFDVNVPHPCSKSYVKHTAADGNWLIHKMESRKHHKHVGMAVKNGFIFHPVVCETFGATGDRTEHFFTLIARLARQQNPHDIDAAKHAVKIARQEMAVAIQNGVAHHVEHMFHQSLPRHNAASRQPREFRSF